MDAADTYDKSLVDFLRNNAFLSSRYRLVYVSTPKVACTSLKWWFASLEGHAQALRGLGDTRESDLDLLIHDNFYKVAPDVTGLSMDVLAEPLESESFFRFALTRNPYKRVFSAWQSKLLLREPLQIDPYLRSEFFYHPIDTRQEIALAFERFLEHVSANEAPSFWDQHWTPQTLLLRPDKVRYSLIAKIEKPRELSEALAKWSNGTLPDPMAVPRKNESLIPYLPEFLTPRSAEMIRSLYAEDFRVFDYDVEPPPAKEAFDDGQLDVAIKAVKLIRARHERLGARALQMEELKNAMAERDKRVADLDQALDARVAELNQVIAGHDGEIAEREARLADLDRTLADRDGELAGMRDAIVRISVDMAALEHALAERDARIAQHDESVATSSRESTALRDALGQRDARIHDLEEKVHNLLLEADIQREGTDRGAAEQEVQLRRIAEDAAALADKDAQIHALQHRVDAVLGSRSWRIAAPLRGASTLGRGVISAPARLKRRVAALSPRARSAIRAIRESELFDADWYLLTNPDVASTGIDPATHYHVYGWRERRNPSRHFDTAAYLAANPDVDASGANPLAHYLRHGRNEKRPLALTPVDGHTSSKDPIEQPVDPGFQAWSHDHAGDGDAGSAVALAAEPAPPPEAFPDPERIASDIGVIRKSGRFDEAYYLSMNRDLDPPPADPIRHYCEQGWREGRNPSDEFDTQFYLDTYRDIRDAGLNPLWHYAIAGANEGRDSLPNTSARYEDDIRFGAIETDIRLLAFYASPDWAALKRGKALFKGHAQPRKPISMLGEYDLADRQTIERQATLAAGHGLEGFCFDLSEKVALDDQPVGRMHAASEIDFRFCVRVEPSADSDVDALVSLVLRLIADRRYVRVDGRPLVLVKAQRHRSGAPSRIGAVRDALQQGHGAMPFLVGQGVDPDASGDEAMFDAVLDLPADPIPGETGDYAPVEKSGVGAVPYGVVVSNALGRIETLPQGSPTTFRCVTLARDTTIVRTGAPLVYTRFHFREYRRWLDAATAEARARQPEDRRFVFINAWNDWNQALHLEPDTGNGFILLNETTRALAGIEPGLKMPRVSVVVPNYNHEAHLRQRLDSIYDQTYRNIDVILLDDRSSDGSRAIMEEYALAHPDITRVLFNDTNSGGPFHQWAKGIQAAKGELVWIAESDDSCDSRFLEVLVRCFDDEAVLLAYGRSAFVDRDGKPIADDFEAYVASMACRDKWKAAYVASAHEEVRSSLGIKNTIPNASAVLFRRPGEKAFLDDPNWRSMRVAGDWVFYLHVLRGGRIAYAPDAVNVFRRYPGSTAEQTYAKEIFYRELGIASRTVAALYDVSAETLAECRAVCESTYRLHVPNGSVEEFERWYDQAAIDRARAERVPNIMVSTMGFYPGGAEILPIRMANELKRQGHSVLLFSTGLNISQDGVRRMVRNDVPVVEDRTVDAMKRTIEEFGIEALNTHQWHVQKYPLQVPDVFARLRSHVASLHGMIEHGEAFEVTGDQLKTADRNVTDWVYTADKNIEPFRKLGLLDETSGRFLKLPNGMEPPAFVPVPRARLDIPEDAFVLCCVSRAIPDKGWAEMIDAVALARELSGKDIRLLLVGNGPVYDDYCRTGVPAFVHLTGFSADSVGHYAAADMGIMLTRFKSESFPLTIVDCLFAGKPYIASDVGDIRNMLSVGEDVAGAVVDLEDWEVPIEKAARVIADFADGGAAYRDAVALVEKAARRFRIDEVVSRYVELFAAGRQRPRLGQGTGRP